MTLSFKNRPERLTIPFDAITAFADPSVKFGLQFQRGRPSRPKRAPTAPPRRRQAEAAKPREARGQVRRGRRPSTPSARNSAGPRACRDCGHRLDGGRKRCFSTRAQATAKAQTMSDFAFHEMFPAGRGRRRPTASSPRDHVAHRELRRRDACSRSSPPALTLLARAGLRRLPAPAAPRPSAAAPRRSSTIPRPRANDHFVAFDLLKNANIAAGKVLPMCQDTGTAIVMGKKGQRVWTGGGDAAALAAGIRETYTETNLRYSQVAPLVDVSRRSTPATTCRRRSTSTPTRATNTISCSSPRAAARPTRPSSTSRRQAVLNPAALLKFLDEKIRTLGTAACPPYHLAIVIGGTSAELNLKTVKLASCRYLDTLPPHGNQYGQAFRDRELEEEVLALTRRHGHRRAVRRQVFLPRRARHPPAAPRRQPAHRHRRLLLRRPPDPRQDQRQGRLPRAARDQPRASTCPRSTPKRSAARSCGSISPGRWPRSARPCRSYPIKTRLVAHAAR